MIIEREQLEAQLAWARDNAAGPQEGLFGPGSLFWRYSADNAVFLAGGRAALMQLAHPFVGTAIAQHSDAAQNPLGRFQRTFDQVFRMVYGPLDEAMAAARTVHAVHTRIHGTLDEEAAPYSQGDRYCANDREALRWVRATLLHSSVVAMRAVGEVPSARQLDALYDESLRFAALFGLRPQDLSPDWETFEAYVEQTSARLSVTSAARHIGQLLLRPPALRPAPLAYWYRVLTTGLLPPALRSGFGLPFGSTEQAVFRRSMRVLPYAHRAIPARLRRVPGYADALWRLGGRKGRDPLAAWLERLALRVALGAGG